MTSPDTRIANQKESTAAPIKRWLAIFLGLIFVSLIIFLLFYKLDSWPSVWWDEGWSLDAARNWITRGHLGQYLDGQPVPPRIPVRFTMVLPIAIGMKVFGIGLWQGRLPSVIFTILSLGILAYLCSKIFNRKVGIAVLVLSLFFSPMDFNPILLGRQVLAEMPMIFYLLSGYALSWLALTRSPAWGAGAALLFGVALHAKLQVPPFWLASIILAVWVAARHQQRSSTKILAGIATGSIAVAVILLVCQSLFMQGSLSEPTLTEILFNSVIMVFTWSIRKAALTTGVLYSMPQLLGMIWAGQHTAQLLFAKPVTETDKSQSMIVNKEIIRAALWGLGASWYIWYLALALSWTRYMFPPFLIGCIFFTAYLDKLSAGFNLRLFVRRVTGFLLFRELRWINFQAVIILVASSILLGVTIKSGMVNLSVQFPNPNLAAEYLHDYIQAGARVESFESELLFLAPEINFHYPSDLVSMELVRKRYIEPDLMIDYDPLMSNPEYLVSGPYAQLWYLYDEKTIQKWFQLQAEVGGYRIYRIKILLTENNINSANH